MRITPNRPPQDFKTYQMVAPLSTHFIVTTCDEVGCKDFLNGWKVPIGVGDEARANLEALRKVYPGQGTVIADTGTAWVEFEPGTPCLKRNSHKTRDESRPPLYIVKDGDYRGNPRGTQSQVCDGPNAGFDQWVERYSEHRDQIS